MKKIIAMLLCVAMVAALSVAAFADLKGITDPKVSSVEELVQAKKDAAADKTALEAYAASLAAAKKAAGDAKAALADVLSNVKAAAQAAQYNALEAYFNAAAEKAEIEIETAINNYLAEITIALG